MKKTILAVAMLLSAAGMQAMNTKDIRVSGAGNVQFHDPIVRKNDGQANRNGMISEGYTSKINVPKGETAILKAPAFESARNRGERTANVKGRAL